MDRKTRVYVCLSLQVNYVAGTIWGILAALRTPVTVVTLLVIYLCWFYMCTVSNSMLFCYLETATVMAAGDIWFRFKEGYLNAVRKTVRIQDLMSWQLSCEWCCFNALYIMVNWCPCYAGFLHFVFIFVHSQSQFETQIGHMYNIYKCKGIGKGKCIAVCINTYTATGNHLPYGITQCMLDFILFAP